MSIKRYLIAGACLLGAGLIVYFSFRSDEPRYKGRSLHSWLDQLQDGKLVNGRSAWYAQNGLTWAVLPERTPTQLEAVAAIQAIGTNAIPYLLSDLSAQNPTFFNRWERIKATVKTKWFGKTAYIRGEPTPAEQIRWKAALGLEVLGTNAVLFVPQISPFLNNFSSDSAAKSAAYILGGMGDEGTAVLTNALTSNNDWTALCAIWSLAQHRSIANTNWVPLLMQASLRKTNSTYWPLGGVGVWAIGEIHLDSARCIPFLTNMLSASDPNVRSQAASSLGKFGKDAAMAIPLLKQLSNEPDSRWYAREALKRIQKETGDKNPRLPKRDFNQ